MDSSSASKASARPPSAARDRIIRASLPLFAEKGYRGTTVADIASAAGLSPGAGGIYKHFNSKEEVLAGAIDWAAKLTEVSLESLQHLPAGKLRPQLRVVAVGAFAVLDSSVDILRLLVKEAGTFPELVDDLQDRIIQPAFTWFAGWLSNQGVSSRPRAESLSVTALGALMNHWLMEQVLGAAPLGTSRDVFVRGWASFVADAVERS